MQFLVIFKIIDYSLMIALDQYEADRFLNVQIGIIDFLQKFEFKKKVEYKFKHMIGLKNYSVVPPDQYAQRFLDTVNKIFVELTEAEKLD